MKGQVPNLLAEVMTCPGAYNVADNMQLSYLL